MLNNGEIAYKVLKVILQKHGVELKKVSKEEFAEFAEEVGVPEKELREFAKPLLQEILDEML